MRHLLSLWDIIMRDYPVGIIVRLERLFSESQKALAFSDAPVPEDVASSVLESLKEMSSILEEVSLKFTVVQINRLVQEAEARGFDRANMSAGIGEARQRYIDELSNMHFLELTPEESKYYKNEFPIFGEHVAEKFPSLEYEFKEISACLALGRSTAAVFHSLRVLEGGFAALWRSLKVSDPIHGYERNWSNRVKRVEAAIENNWPKSSGRGSADAKFYDEVVGALKGMQNPYRNSTMHLDQIYTEDDARHIIELIKGFMKKVASRMDEDGRRPRKPKKTSGKTG